MTAKGALPTSQPLYEAGQVVSMTKLQNMLSLEQIYSILFPEGWGKQK